MTPRKRPYLLRTLTAFAAAFAAALLPAIPTAAAEADGTGAAVTALSGLTLTTVNGGRNLDVQNGNTGEGVFLVTNSAPGYHQQWSADLQANGSFTLVNDTTGKCAAVGVPLRQQNCSGVSAQRWYFQPVTGAANTFMIRNAGTHKCLDIVLGAQYDDAWTQTYTCNGSAAQKWRLPASASPAAFEAAVDFASVRCQQDASTCTWRKGVQAPAEPLPRQCVSPVWYNGTPEPVQWTFTLSTSSGWTSTLGIQFTTGVSGGTPGALQATVSQTITGSVSYDLRETLGNSLTVSVPPAHYGWVALAALATEVTGEWTFDAGGYPWKTQDTVTVPLTSDTQGGASVYLARTGAEFTGCAA